MKKDVFLTDEDYDNAVRNIWTQPLDIDFGTERIETSGSNPFAQPIQPFTFPIEPLQ